MLKRRGNTAYKRRCGNKKVLLGLIKKMKNNDPSQTKTRKKDKNEREKENKNLMQMHFCAYESSISEVWN